MPIDDDMREQYPDQWDALRDRVLDRASWVAPPDEPTLFVKTSETPRCERCAKPNHETVITGPDGAWVDERWIHHPLGPDRPVWRDEEGEMLDHEYTGERSSDSVRVVLTIAHTCQDPRCDDLQHLQALCQRCHLQLDGQPAERARREQIKSEIRGQQALFGGGGCR